MLVEVKNDDFDAALRRLKKLMRKENVLKDYCQKQEYEKPSEKKRRKRQEAARLRKRDERAMRED